MQSAVDTALADQECYGLEDKDARMSCFFNKVGLFANWNEICSVCIMIIIYMGLYTHNFNETFENTGIGKCWWWSSKTCAWSCFYWSWCSSCIWHTWHCSKGENFFQISDFIALADPCVSCITWINSYLDVCGLSLSRTCLCLYAVEGSEQMVEMIYSFKLCMICVWALVRYGECATKTIKTFVLWAFY